MIVFFIHRAKRSALGTYGADTMLLTWDNDLEKAAKNYASNMCPAMSFIHEANGCRQTDWYDSVGQNILQLHNVTEVNEEELAEKAFQSWYSVCFDKETQFLCFFKHCFFNQYISPRNIVISGCKLHRAYKIMT